MKVLDLCAGTGSATQAFVDRGHEVHRLDIHRAPGVDLIMDVRDAEFDTGIFDFIWASPPCNCFSVMTIGRYWKDHEPVGKAIDAIGVVQNCIRIIENNKGLFVIENPVGMLRTTSIMKALERKYFHYTVTYCQYGNSSRKPTDLWSNVPFYAKKCKTGASCHIQTPRNVKNPGSLKTKPLHERMAVPYKLSLEICKAVETAVAEA